MAQLPDIIAAYYPQLKDRHLNELVLPGSHDSGAYQLLPSAQLSGPAWQRALYRLLLTTLKPWSEPWVVTQLGSTHDQLMSGVRFFDLRLSVGRPLAGGTAAADKPSTTNAAGRKELASATAAADKPSTTSAAGRKALTGATAVADEPSLAAGRTLACGTAAAGGPSTAEGKAPAAAAISTHGVHSLWGTPNGCTQGAAAAANKPSHDQAVGGTRQDQGRVMGLGKGGGRAGGEARGRQGKQIGGGTGGEAGGEAGGETGGEAGGREGEEAEEYFVTHGLPCVLLRCCLEDVRTFLNKHPREVVVLRLSADWDHRQYMGPAQGDAVLRMVHEVLGDLLFDHSTLQPPSTPLHTRSRLSHPPTLPTLEAVVTSGRPVIVFAELPCTADPAECGTMYLNAGCKPFWADSPTADGTLQGIAQQVQQAKARGAAGAELRFAAFAATPDVRTVVTGVAAQLAGQPSGLRAMAGETAALLPQLLALDLRGVAMAVTVDFPTAGDVMAIMNANLV